jgi:hypothetical protein
MFVPNDHVTPNRILKWRMNMGRKWKYFQITAGIIVGVTTMSITVARAKQPLPSGTPRTGKEYRSIPLTPPRFPGGVPQGVTVGSPVGESVEDRAANEVQIYFKKRWKRDPDFNGYLQYHLTLQADGRVKSIVGIGNNSQTYLEYTNFVRLGEKLVTANDRERVVRIFLNGNGAVGVYPLKMPPS